MRLFRETLSTVSSPVCSLQSIHLHFVIIFYKIHGYLSSKKKLTKDTTIQTYFIGPKIMGN